MARRKKLDIDGWGNPLPENLKKEKKISPKKEKLNLLEEKEVEVFHEVEPSMSFCSLCKHSDIRVIKDRMNEAVILIKIVAEELGITGEKYDNIKKDLIEWVRKERNLRESILKKKIKGKNK